MSAEEHIVLSLTHYGLVGSLADMLHLVAISLDKAQSYSTSLTDAYHIMNKLIDDILLDSCCDAVHKRRASGPGHLILALPYYNNKTQGELVSRGAAEGF